MKNDRRAWFSYVSKDKKVRGIVPAKDYEEIARYAKYPVEQLIIERVEWNGEEWVKRETNT